MAQSSIAPRHAAELTLAAAAWGVGIVLSKQAVAEIPPLSLLPVQLAVSVAFLALAARRVGAILPSGPSGRLLARLGLLTPGLSYALSLLGLTQITASLSVLLWAAEPLMILALAAVFLNERLAPGLVVLSGVAVAGMLLVLYDPSASGAVVGVALTLAGVACCAVYSVVTRRWLPTADSTVGVVLAQQVHALALAMILLVGATVLGVGALPVRLTVFGIVSALVSGLVYYGIAYWFYLLALRGVPASVAAVSFYLIPVFGVAAGLVVGERLAPVQWLGAATVAVAVAVIGWRSSRPNLAGGSRISRGPATRP